MAAADIDQRDAYRLVLKQNEVFFAYGPMFGRKTMQFFCQWDEISAFCSFIFPFKLCDLRYTILSDATAS